MNKNNYKIFMNESPTPAINAKRNLKRTLKDAESVTAEFDEGLHKELQSAQKEETELREELKDIEEAKDVLNKALKLVEEVEKLEKKFEEDIEKAKELPEEQREELFKEDMKNLLRDLDRISSALDQSRNMIQDLKEHKRVSDEQISTMTDIENEIVRGLVKIGVDTKQGEKHEYNVDGPGLLEKIERDCKELGIIEESY
jgi:chromosome segregation ATPase